jgi:enoyl-CoA hydratase/carnithine racemase
LETSFKTLRYEEDDGVAVVTLDRPEVHNAFNQDMQEELRQLWRDLRGHDPVRVIILTGAGDKAFSAGMDLKAFASGEGGSIMGAPGGFAGITQRTFSKPIIAAVNGAALAGGCEIMLACELVVAADHATFGIPEVKRGLFAGAGGLIRLPKRLPLAIALELALTGESIDADRALALGLVNRVVPAGRLIEEAFALADVIADNAPLAVRWTKKVVVGAVSVGDKEGWALNNEAVGIVFTSADAMEGPVAFAEKRKPRWQGK